MLIPPHQDAYGQLLLAVHLGHDVPEVIERDDGYVDASFSMRHYAELTPLDRRVLAHARGRVLDLGAGLGRHALWLQRRGYDVLATDNSPLAVRLARAEGVRRARLLDIEDLTPRLGAFETILLLGNNLGLLGSRARAGGILERLAAVTSPTGQILAESTNPYPPPDAPTRAYQARNRRLGRLPGQVRMRIRYRQFATPWFDYLFASPAELAAIVAGTPWRLHRVLKTRTRSYAAILRKR